MSGWPALAIKILKQVTVGTSQTAIAHGLGYVQASSGVRVYAIIVGYNAAAHYVSQTIAPDATNVYLIADAASTLCDVWVGPDTSS